MFYDEHVESKMDKQIREFGVRDKREVKPEAVFSYSGKICINSEALPAFEQEERSSKVEPMNNEQYLFQ